MKKILAFLLCISLLLNLLSCSPSEADKLYDEMTKEGSSSTSPASSEASQPEESSTPEASTVSQPETDGEYYDPFPDGDLERYVQKLEWEQLFDIEPNTELSGTLTIAVDSSSSLEPWIRAFQAVYPNVEIKTNLYPLTSDESTARLIVDLNSGTAGDIVYMVSISMYKYGESGLFQDLYPYIDADPDLQREDFYTNILEALETKDGKLCCISSEIDINTVYFNTQVTDKLGIDFRRDYPDGMTNKDVTDLYQRCVDEGALDADAPLSPLGSKMYMCEVVLPGYFDEVAQEANFEDPGFIEYLKTMDRIPAYNRYDSWAVDYSFQEENEFMVEGNDSFTCFQHYLENDKERNSSVWVPTKTDNGKKIFQPRRPMGITSACQNTELAWEFIKFMISEKPFPEKPTEGYVDIGYTKLYSFHTPINRKVFKSLLDTYYGSDELFQYLDGVYSQRNIPSLVDSRFMLAVCEIMKGYWENGLISAEECAKQMQERAWIYVNE